MHSLEQDAGFFSPRPECIDQNRQRLGFFGHGRRRAEDTRPAGNILCSQWGRDGLLEIEQRAITNDVVVAEQIQLDARVRREGLDDLRFRKRAVANAGRNMRHHVDDVVEEAIIRDVVVEDRRPGQIAGAGRGKQARRCVRPSFGDVFDEEGRQCAAEAVADHHYAAVADQLLDSFRRVLGGGDAGEVGEAHRLIDAPETLLDSGSRVARMRNRNEIGIDEPFDNALGTPDCGDEGLRVGGALGNIAVEYPAAVN
jgi:hypothetical protein